MTRDDLLLILTQTLVPTLPAVLAYLKAREAAKAVEVVHVAINSRLTELLAQTSLAQHAAGRAEGVIAGAESTRPPIVVVQATEKGTKP